MDLFLPLLSSDFMGKPAWIWLVFISIVVALLAFDLGVLHKGDSEIGVRESLLLSAGVTFGLIAGGVLVSLWKTRGQPTVGGAS